MPSTPKYRLILSKAMIVRILDLAKTDPTNTIDMQLIATLAPYLSKINNAAIKPAYTIEPRDSIMQEIGAEPSSSFLAGIDKEEYWKLCWQKYSEQPTICTLQEIQAAQEYRYLHDLMSVEEVEEHEDTLTGLHANLQAPGDT